MKQIILLDLVILFLTTLDSASSHVVNYTAPHISSNLTEPSSPSGTVGPLRWLRRQLPVSTGTPEHRSYQNTTASQGHNETSSSDKAVHFITSLKKLFFNEPRNHPYSPVYPVHNLTVPLGPTGTGKPAVHRRTHVPYSIDNTTGSAGPAVSGCSTMYTMVLSSSTETATHTSRLPMTPAHYTSFAGHPIKNSTTLIEPTGSHTSRKHSSLVGLGNTPVTHSAHPTSPPYPTVNSTHAGTPSASRPMLHTPKLPGSSATYTDSSGSMPTGHPSTSSHAVITRVSPSHSVAPPIEKTTSYYTAGPTTITLSHSVGVMTIVSPPSVAVSISSIASVSGFSAAQSVASVAMSSTKTSVSVVSQISDGQIQAPTTKVSPVSQITDGQIQVPGTTHVSTHTEASSKPELHGGSVVTQISDGQVQASKTTGSVISQISDSHQAPKSTGSAVNQISDGQVQASKTTGSVISQISDSHQAPKSTGSAVSQISDGQLQAPASSHPDITNAISKGSPLSTSTASHAISQITDGQVQLPASKSSVAPVSQITDGQIQAPVSASTTTPVSQITDGQVQAPASKPTVAPASQVTDGQIQAPASKSSAAPVSQITDGQIQAPVPKSTVAPASQITDGQIQAPASKSTVTPVSQITDGQVQAPVPTPTVAPISQISDGQVQAPGSTVTPVSSTPTSFLPSTSAVSQVSDGQVQVAPTPSPETSAPAPQAPAPPAPVTVTQPAAPPPPPAPPVYTETQTSYVGPSPSPSPSYSSSSSSTMTDTTAPTVPPGTLSEPLRGEAKSEKMVWMGTKRLLAMAAAIVYLV